MTDFFPRGILLTPVVFFMPLFLPSKYIGFYMSFMFNYMIINPIKAGGGGRLAPLPIVFVMP